MSYSIDSYKEQAVVSEDPYLLILKLYEGLLKNQGFIKRAIEDGNIEEKFNFINKNVDIFEELRAILDFDGGDIAHYLDGLYVYQIQLLFEAGLDNDLHKVEQVTNVVKGLIEAWKEEIAKRST
jgi:flagellar protein FliS